MISFIHLIQMQVSHEYYTNNVDGAIDVSLSNESKSLLANAGILYKYSAGLLRVLGTSDSINALDLYVREHSEQQAQQIPSEQNIKEPVIALLISARASEIYQITTDVPPPDQQCWYVSNREEYQQTPHFLNDRNVLNKTQQLAVSDPQIAKILPRENRNHSVIGIVEISVKQLLKTLKASAYLDFTLQMQSTKSLWKYLIQDNQQRKLEIIDLHGVQQFRLTQAERLNNQDWVCYLSDREIVLKEHNSAAFQLNSIVNNESQMLVSRLPVASPMSIHKQVVNGEQAVVSEIFVYL